MAAGGREVGIGAGDDEGWSKEVFLSISLITEILASGTGVRTWNGVVSHVFGGRSWRIIYGYGLG